MKKFLSLIIILSAAANTRAQDQTGNLRIGLTASLTPTLNADERLAFDQYTGYAIDYRAANYRLGLNLEYESRRAFAITGGINYLNKDFSETYYCDVCDFSEPPLPADIKFRFVEFPVTIRYYFLPGNFRMFGEIGINNHFLLNQQRTYKSYFAGLKFGAGFEYSLSHNLALHFFADYHKGMTKLLNESDLRLDYTGFGIGVWKGL